MDRHADEAQPVAAHEPQLALDRCGGAQHRPVHDDAEERARRRGRPRGSRRAGGQEQDQESEDDRREEGPGRRVRAPVRASGHGPADGSRTPRRRDYACSHGARTRPRTPDGRRRRRARRRVGHDDRPVGAPRLHPLLAAGGRAARLCRRGRRRGGDRPRAAPARAAPAAGAPGDRAPALAAVAVAAGARAAGHGGRDRPDAAAGRRRRRLAGARAPRGWQRVVASGRSTRSRCASPRRSDRLPRRRCGEDLVEQRLAVGHVEVLGDVPLGLVARAPRQREVEQDEPGAFDV